MILFPHRDYLRFCPFPKHEGVAWEEVVEQDLRYVEWLISGEGPNLEPDLLDHLTILLEERDSDEY